MSDSRKQMAEDPRRVLTKLRMFSDHSGPPDISLTRREVESLRRLLNGLTQLGEAADPRFWDAYDKLCLSIAETMEFP